MAFSRIIIATIIACALVSMTSAAPGIATFFKPPYIPSSCYGFQDQGTMIGAANYVCGTMLRVQCTGPIPACRAGTMIVKIVNNCPRCAPNQISLSQEAFSVIANPDAGRIQIDYVGV